MGIAFAKLLQNLFGKRQARVVMVGLDAAGKTTILHHMAFGETIETLPTIGFTLQTVKQGKLEFNVWDIGGQTELRHLWQHYYRNADGVIFVVDSADLLESRKLEAKEALEGVSESEDLSGVPFLVFANKQDVSGCMDPAAVSKMLGVDSLRANGREVHVEGCSGLSGQGLDAGLKWLSAACERRWAKK